jgi:outer membrane protein assembly factor BamE (lipoprotein component of BamABCDE complex)
MAHSQRATHKRGAGRCQPILAVVLAAGLAGACSSPSESFTRGQKITAEQLEQVPVGSSKEQVYLAFGTPSSTGLNNGDGALYYISQTQSRAVAFMRPHVTDRRILVVYLAGDETVKQIAEYGLKDGKVFDYLSRRTRTGGTDLAFISQFLSGVANPSLF